MLATSRLHRIRELSLWQSVASGMFHKFIGTEGPTERLGSHEQTALDYLQQLWSTHLCMLLADQTNHYALQQGISGWKPVTAGKIWTFLGVTLLMSMHTLPHFESYWSKDSLPGILSLSLCMSRARFRQPLHHLHLYNEASCDDPTKKDCFYKVRRADRTYTFCSRFSASLQPEPGVSVNKMMIKCKGWSKAKIYMLKKLIKWSFKV